MPVVKGFSRLVAADHEVKCRFTGNLLAPIGLGHLADGDVIGALRTKDPVGVHVRIGRNRIGTLRRICIAAEPLIAHDLSQSTLGVDHHRAGSLEAC